MSGFIRLTYEEKLELVDGVRELDPKRLSELVGVVKEKCGRAFKQVDDDNCQIIVDYLDKRTIEEIQVKVIKGDGKRVKSK